MWKSLKIDEIRSEIVRYGLQCSEKLEISKSGKKSRKMKVVPTGSPGVENVPAPRESILTLSRGSQLPYATKKHVSTNTLNFRFSPISLSWPPHFCQQMQGSIFSLWGPSVPSLDGHSWEPL